MHDPNPPFHFDEEITFTIFDWYHEQMPDLIYTYQSHAGIALDGTPNPTGGALINAQKDAKIYVKPNTTYYIHMVCPGNYAGQAWYFDGHPVTTIETDGVYVQPQIGGSADTLTRMAPGQRQGILLQTKNDTSKNYGIWGGMDVNMLFTYKGVTPVPKDYASNVTAWLVYDDTKALPPTPILYELDDTVFFDDLYYKPLDGQAPLGPVDHQIIMETNSKNISGISRSVYIA